MHTSGLNVQVYFCTQSIVTFMFLLQMHTKIWMKFVVTTVAKAYRW